MIRFWVGGIPKSMKVSGLARFQRDGKTHMVPKRGNSDWALLVGKIGRDHAAAVPRISSNHELEVLAFTDCPGGQLLGELAPQIECHGELDVAGDGGGLRAMGDGGFGDLVGRRAGAGLRFRRLRRRGGLEGEPDGAPGRSSMGRGSEGAEGVDVAFAPGTLP